MKKFKYMNMQELMILNNQALTADLIEDLESNSFVNVHGEGQTLTVYEVKNDMSRVEHQYVIRPGAQQEELADIMQQLEAWTKKYDCQYAEVSVNMDLKVHQHADYVYKNNQGSETIWIDFDSICAL